MNTPPAPSPEVLSHEIHRLRLALAVALARAGAALIESNPEAAQTLLDAAIVLEEHEHLGGPG